MGTLEAIATITSIVAWPLTILAIALIIRPRRRKK